MSNVCLGTTPIKHRTFYTEKEILASSDAALVEEDMLGCIGIRLTKPYARKNC